MTEKEPEITSFDVERDQKGFETPDGEQPTEYEKRTLRHVGENLPFSAWLVAVVELCERFTYYGVSGIFMNYAQNPLDGSKGPGALGAYDSSNCSWRNFRVLANSFMFRHGTPRSNR